MRKYAFYHLGQDIPRRKEDVASDLAKYYAWRDLRRYDKMNPEEQNLALGGFAKRHRIYKALESKEDAQAELEKVLKKKKAGVLRIIYRDELIEPQLQGPPPSRRKSRQNPGPPVNERYQLELFG